MEVEEEERDLVNFLEMVKWKKKLDEKESGVFIGEKMRG